MKIKWKLTIYSTAWLSLILIIFNVVLYFSFIEISTQSEISFLYNKADTILANDGDEIIKQDELLKANLGKNEIIRVLDRKGSIKQQVVSRANLAEYPPESVKSRQNKLFTKNGEKILFVRVPMHINKAQTGTLEIGRVLENVSTYGEILYSIQIAAIFLAVLFSIGGGYLFSHLALKPISQIIYTIKNIRVLGLNRRIEVKTTSKDEIYELKVTFNEMLDRIESAFLAQQRFLADASHELRTPLTIIESYANLLKRWGSKDPEIQEEAIREIQTEAARLKELTNALLDITSVEKESFDVQEIDLISFIKEGLIPFRQVYHRSIRFHHDKKQLTLKYNKARLKQLFVILLDNAMKYSEKEVTITVRDTDHYVEMAVMDRGVGIPKEDIPYVLDRFYRVDKNRSRQTGGKGLGLSIAKTILEKYGGELEIKSEVNRWTEMLIKFPKNIVRGKDM
jgi:two-component system, OmpR family, sensor histidine kinase ArlS